MSCEGGGARKGLIRYRQASFGCLNQIDVVLGPRYKDVFENARVISNYLRFPVYRGHSARTGGRSDRPRTHHSAIASGHRPIDPIRSCRGSICCRGDGCRSALFCTGTGCPRRRGAGGKGGRREGGGEEVRGAGG